MSYILDLVLVGIIALCAWKGYKSGILVSVLGIIALIISLVVGNVVSKAYSGEFSGIMEPFVTGVVDKSISNVLDTTPEDGKKAAGERSAFLVPEKDRADVYKVSFAALRDLGIAEKPAGDLAEQVKGETSDVNQQMSTVLTEKLCARIAYVLVFIIIFIITAIIFVVIENIADIKFTLPGAEKINGIAGAVLGVVKGVIIVMFIASIFRYAAILIPGTLISKTIILKLFINSNAIASAVGI